MTASNAESPAGSYYGDVKDEDLVLPDGRTIAWTRTGPEGGVPLLRLPGTPGSRWFVRADRTPWRERNLEVITTERAGMGRSTPLPGRGLRQHADDLIRILDHLGLDQVRAVAISGGGPHLLALAAQYPDRLAAATIVVGTPLLLEHEIDQMIDQNAAAYRLVRKGDRSGLREFLAAPFAAMKSDPVGGVRKVMAQAPATDQEIMADPLWQVMFRAALTAALAQDVEGWGDDTMAIFGTWSELELRAVRTDITWWHGANDKNCPLPAVRRLIEGLSTVTLRELGDVGHFEPYRREAEILDELLTRG